MKKSQKMDHQETAVIIEKDIEELNSMHKFDQNINLSAYYHLNRCENGVRRSNWDFLLKLRYIYIEHLVGRDGIAKYITKLLSETLWIFSLWGYS